MNDIAGVEVAHPRGNVLREVHPLLPRQRLVHVVNQIFESPSAYILRYEVKFLIFAQHSYKPKYVVMV